MQTHAAVVTQMQRHEVQLALDLVGGAAVAFMSLKRYVRHKRSAPKTAVQMDLLERIQSELNDYEAYPAPVDLPVETALAGTDVGTEADPRQGWSLDAIEKMHLNLFDASLKGILHWKTADRDRIELISWMLIEDEAPFSFDVCAALSGVESDEIRTRVLQMVRKEHPDLAIPDARALNSTNEIEKLLARGAAYFGAER